MACAELPDMRQSQVAKRMRCPPSFGFACLMFVLSGPVAVGQLAFPQEMVCQIATEPNTSLQANLGITCNVTHSPREAVASDGNQVETGQCECTVRPSRSVWHQITALVNSSMAANAQPGEFFIMDETGRCVLSLEGRNMTEPLPCPPGFWCEGGLAPPRSCSNGDHCPWNTAAKRRCPAGYYCPSPSGPAIACPKGVLCPDGSWRPQACQAGSYCIGGQSWACEANHYCPVGSEWAQPCRLMAHCPVGSAYEDLRILCLAILLVFAAIAYTCRKFYDAVQQRRVFACCVCAAPVAAAWLVNLEIAIFASLLYGLVVVNWALLQVGTCPQWIARLVLVMTLGIVLAALYRVHPQWSWFLAGIILLSFSGFLMQRQVLVAEVLGRLSAVLFFCGLFVAMWRTDRLVTALFLGFICLSVIALVSSWFLQQWLQFRRVSLPPFLTRWRLGSASPGHPRGDSLIPSGGSNFGSFSGSFAGSETEPTWVSRWRIGNDEPSQSVISLQAVAAEAVAAEAAPSPAMQSPRSRVKGVSFQLQGVNFELPDTTRLLSDISLDIARGRRVAVMGPSGSGKSTLLAVLSGRASYGQISGNIRVSGRPAHDLRFLRHVTGFVPQDDILHGELNVRENIRYQAMLRLPSDMQDCQVEACVDEVLQELSLSAIALQRVGSAERRGISGGQRKRVSIAMELVTQPLLLFADEPTSGLDSTTSHDVVRSLNDAAANVGATVIAVIHQPRYETLCLFDDLVLLGVGGCLVYAGATSKAVDYFKEHLHVTFPQNMNPADVFLDSVQPPHSTPEACAEVWKSLSPSTEVEDGGAEIFARERPALIRATLVFMDRALRQMLQRYDTFVLDHVLCLGATVVVCVVVKNETLDNFMMQSAFAALALMLLQGVAAQRTFGADLLVTWREAQVGMPMVPYFVGKDLASLFEITFSAATFTAVYGALSHSQLPLPELYAGSWTFIYSVTGLSYIFSIIASPTAAQMSAVVASFVSFCVAGVYKPPLPFMVSYFGGRGWMIPVLSSIRWFWGYMLTLQARYVNPVTRGAAWGHMRNSGYDFGYLDMCQSGYKLSLNERSLPEEWASDRGWVCSVSQMLLLGILFRFIAGVSLLFYVSAETSGWVQFFGKSQTGVWKLVGKVATLLIGAFMAMFLFAEIWVLGSTRMTWWIW